MAVATSGCVIAIIASFIPWPLLATKKMDNTGKFLIRKLHSVWVNLWSTTLAMTRIH